MSMLTRHLTLEAQEAPERTPQIRQVGMHTAMTVRLEEELPITKHGQSQMPLTKSVRRQLPIHVRRVKAAS